MEITARVYISWTRGSQTAGMKMRSINLMYKPFVMFGRDWDKVLSQKKFPLNPENKTCRVMLVGGSTAGNFPVKILEDSLTRMFKGTRFQVINASFGGYIARQQVIVTSIWGPRLKPNLLLSLDGANDLIHRIRVSKPGTFFLDSTYDLYLTRPLLAPFVYILSRSQLYNGISRLMIRRKISSADEYEDAIPVYINSQESLNVLAKGMGAKRLMILQPFSAFKEPLTPRESAFKIYKYREKVVKELYVRTAKELYKLAQRDDVSYLDARKIFNGTENRVFTDDVHLTNHGYQVLATYIAEKLSVDFGGSSSFCDMTNTN